VENKYIEDKETAKLYVEGLSTMLNGNIKNLSTFCESLDKKLGGVDTQSNELYESLDVLSEKDTLSNIENKVIAKKKLVEHLTKKKSVESIVENTTYTANENLLHAVLVNNFNNLYENTLTQEDKEQLKNILDLNGEDLVTKTKELKESILNKVENILSESKDGDLGSKLQSVKNEVTTMEPSKYNYYRLTQLKNGLD
jgi:phenylalanyl-tRNA synthetase alpha subunit